MENPGQNHPPLHPIKSITTYYGRRYVFFRYLIFQICHKILPRTVQLVMLALEAIMDHVFTICHDNYLSHEDISYKHLYNRYPVSEQGPVPCWFNHPVFEPIQFTRLSLQSNGHPYQFQVDHQCLGYYWLHNINQIRFVRLIYFLWNCHLYWWDMTLIASYKFCKGNTILKAGSRHSNDTIDIWLISLKARQRPLYIRALLSQNRGIARYMKNGCFAINNYLNNDNTCIWVSFLCFKNNALIVYLIYKKYLCFDITCVRVCLKLDRTI